jgi:membrane protease YdiL (CAAX protease family)
MMSTTMTQQTRSRLLLKALLFAVVAFVVTAVTGGIWTALLAVNLATSPAFPWSVAVMALLLWLLWRYLGGAGWPRATADARRRYLRARRTSGRVFAWALTAGLLSIVALAGLWIVLFQVTNLPSRALPDYSKYPLVTVALALVMASLVNAVVEEATFRGYTQGVLEGSVGGGAAILITMLVMAPEHALTQGFAWPVLLTQSILPGIVTHAIGLLVFFTLVWPGDALRSLAGRGDAETWLWIHGAQTLAFTILAILAFIQLARSARQLHAA